MQDASPEKRREGATHGKETDIRVSREGDYFGGLEPYDGKLSRTVLRGEWGRKAPDLPGVKERLDRIERVVIDTQESAIRIISKDGPLYNPADRDHCLQYMTAIGLIFGELTADHYSDRVATDPRIDTLRKRMEVREEPRYSLGYLDPDKRSIANSVLVFFDDGTATERVETEYPLGHRRRRSEALPLIVRKALNNLGTCLPADRAEAVSALCLDRDRLAEMPVDLFMELFACRQSDGTGQLEGAT